MSIDVLQEKIRKLKNPIVLDLTVLPEHIPEHIRLSGSAVESYVRFCCELMEGMKGIIPAVRFCFDQFALMGAEGLDALSKLMKIARQSGFYVILDSTEILTPWGADRAAAAFFGEDSPYDCDGLVISPYIGTDAVKPFIPYCKDGKKDLFLAVRAPTKSAAELQDLLTGTRHVHTAAVDLFSRQGETILGRCGYSHLCALASAGAASSLSNLRGKYKRLFLLVDGIDYPSGNAKNCSYAFDRMGHGAAVCAGPSITAAWLAEQTDGADFVVQAVQAVQRLKKNLNRYFTII